MLAFGCGEFVGQNIGADQGRAVRSPVSGVGQALRVTAASQAKTAWRLTLRPTPTRHHSPGVTAAATNSRSYGWCGLNPGEGPARCAHGAALLLTGLVVSSGITDPAFAAESRRVAVSGCARGCAAGDGMRAVRPTISLPRPGDLRGPRASRA